MFQYLESICSFSYLVPFLFVRMYWFCWIIIVVVYFFLQKHRKKREKKVLRELNLIVTTTVTLWYPEFFAFNKAALFADNRYVILSYMPTFTHLFIFLKLSSQSIFEEGCAGTVIPFIQIRMLEAHENCDLLQVL